MIRESGWGKITQKYSTQEHLANEIESRGQLTKRKKGDTKRKTCKSKGGQ